jgi:hypothetical protein
MAELKQPEMAGKITHIDDLHEYKESEGYVIDAEGRGDLKLAGDGHTILIPQVRAMSSPLQHNYCSSLMIL